MTSDPSRIALRIPASTSNLGPGFDAIGLSLDLYNEFVFERGGRRVEIVVEGEGAESLQATPEHLAYQAFRRACGALGEREAGLRITQRNRVPIGRGLGGSGTAILAGTMAAFVFARETPDDPRILDLAYELEGHPDNVTPSFVGGLTISGIEDDHVRYLRVVPPPSLQAVLFIPAYSLQTERARRVLPASYSREDTVFNIRAAAGLAAAMATGQLGFLKTAMRDRIHQPYRAPLVKGMESLFQAALGAGALGAALSGAGSGILAFAQESTWREVEAAMSAAADRLDVKGHALHLSISTTGAQILWLE